MSIRTNTSGVTASRRIFALLAVLAVGCGERPHDPFEADESLLTLADYLGEGHRRALRHAEDSEGLRGIYARVRDAIVRVKVRVKTGPKTHSTDHGSGAIVGLGRFVATAGHVLEALDEHPDAEIVIVLTDGGRLQGEAVECKDRVEEGLRRDWALVRIVDPPQDLPSLEVRDAEIGDWALMLGYPSETGIDPQGAVTVEPPSEYVPLRPLAHVVRVKNSVRGDARPIAGAVPTGGISGGPLIGPDGKVLGIVHRITDYKDSIERYTSCEFENTFRLKRRLEREME
jgi:S1-C subfamily serine protease